MDLDAYTAAHRDEWERLQQLSRRSRFTGAEADELIDRYQSAATDLSVIRSSAGHTRQGERVSLYLSRARLRFTGTGTNVLERIPEFFLRQVPAALYRIRWASLVVALAVVAVAALFFAWALQGDTLDALMPAAEREQYANEGFVNYYSEYSGTSFGTMVWTNNAWIATQCIAFGILGVYTPYILFQNAQGLGMSAAVMAEQDALDTFFLYISPHGQLELYAIFVAGAAGLAIFWSWVAPGARTRGQALAAGGRSLFTAAVGVTLALFLSGIVEGFVTRQDWPWPIKIGIGTIALAIFLAYQWILGGRAHRRGVTGDLDEFEAGATRLTAG